MSKENAERAREILLALTDCRFDGRRCVEIVSAALDAKDALIAAAEARGNVVAEKWREKFMEKGRECAEKHNPERFEQTRACNGPGLIIICDDDVCLGAGECFHGDGEVLCDCGATPW